ncbi:thiol peroxidase [Corynebacterium gerontici]|uniref:Thiol peroxidase n=1 Tax=Corynebacterium gerontici TaxID=2079234 RepID=A0A3G6J0Q3_9CORY|nr:thiol peroxidase [Corynebacterium gerontici]AZA11537.1 putative thiol peroxidase [Corynebacterium gerontici]
MATTHFQGNKAHTSGDLPAVGEQLPQFELVNADLEAVNFEELQGKRLVLNIFPSVDTGVCATSVREFNERASKLDNTVVLCVSEDLPFAFARFCGAEGINNVVPASAFRSSFAEDFGVKLEDSPLKGLMARAVIVADESGTVKHVELVEEIATEPNYEAAEAALAS